MIGQANLIREIYKQIDEEVFPRFSIVVGDAGSERNDVASLIAQKLNATCVNVADCKVETIREVIVNAYKVSSLTVYNITDADTMSVQAKNALLKVTEEPPNKAYFVMTLDDANNTLATIRSRGAVFDMEPYASSELVGYATTKHNATDKELSLLQLIATTPGDIDMLVSYSVETFYDFVAKVVDNIAIASRCNALKIAQSIRFKDTDESGYDLRLFWRTFSIVCMADSCFNGVIITSKYLSRLRTKTINKGMLFDSWVLDIKQEWVDGNN